MRGWTAIKEQQHDKKKQKTEKKEQTLSCIHAVIFDFPFCKQITKLQKKKKWKFKWHALIIKMVI